jgi:serine/threonine protein kinase
MERIGDYYFKLDDRYLLGRGASSSVYLAKYRGPTKNRLVKNSKVAIKIINTYNLSHRALTVLDEEINIMNMIKNNPHPNIVICYDIFRDTPNNKVYIIMEFCDSGDLFSILVGKPIKEHYVQFYFSQFSNGLRYLYQNKIIHRDIKPQNILLTSEKKILKIADFGFARRTVDNNIMYDTICGSPLYMDPKILNRECYNNQSDLWSIGLILYEMLYGYHPFKECKSIPELRDEILTRDIDIPPPIKINTNLQVSNECLDLLRKLLQKNSNDRITWEQFFDIEWLKKYPDHILVQVQKPESYERKINDMSLGSFGCKFNIPEKFNNLNIIDDYLEKSIDKYIEHKIDNKLDDLIFELELETPKSDSPVLVKCVVDNNSMLPDQKYEIIRSKKIDISSIRSVL